jgi:hypothetical protein
MILIKTIEIDEVETEISIDFSVFFGDVEINQIIDLTTGDSIDVEIDNSTYNELMEHAADLNAERYYTRFRYEY